MRHFSPHTRSFTTVVFKGLRNVSGTPGKSPYECSRATSHLTCSPPPEPPRLVAHVRVPLDVQLQDARAGLLLLRRRQIGQIYLHGRNFMGGFYEASEIFLTPRKRTV